MQHVRMRRQLSGTRNGVHWPEPGGVVEVPDDEAATLVRHGNAARLDDEGDDTSATQEEDEPASEPAAEPQTEPPARSDNKPAWVDYAITQGLTRTEAEAMTKDDLIARFAAEE